MATDVDAQSRDWQEPSPFCHKQRSPRSQIAAHVGGDRLYVSPVSGLSFGGLAAAVVIVVVWVASGWSIAVGGEDGQRP